MYMKEQKHLKNALPADMLRAFMNYFVKTTRHIESGENMTTKGEIYLCEICGNKVQVLEEGAGTLVCCGQDMTLIQ